MNCFTARSTPVSSSVWTWSEPVLEGADRRDHEHVVGGKSQPLVQVPGLGVPQHHLKADMVEPGAACRLDHAGDHGAADSSAARPRPDVDVGDVRRLPAAVAQHTEDEADGLAIV